MWGGGGVQLYLNAVEVGRGGEGACISVRVGRACGWMQHGGFYHVGGQKQDQSQGGWVVLLYKASHRESIMVLPPLGQGMYHRDRLWRLRSQGEVARRLLSYPLDHKLFKNINEISVKKTIYL